MTLEQEMGKITAPSESVASYETSTPVCGP